MEKTPPTQPVNESKNTAENLKKKKNTIITVAVIIFVAIAGYIAWDAYKTKANEKSELALAQVNQDKLMAAPSDSVLLAQYLKVAKEGSIGGKTAALEAAVILYRDTAYADCIKALDKAGSLDSKIAEAGRLSLMGDCYVNLNKLDDGLKCYKKAVSAADKNPEIVPFMLIKEANIYRAQGKYADESKAYEEILKNYPEYANSHDVQKYAERAAAAAKQ